MFWFILLLAVVGSLIGVVSVRAGWSFWPTMVLSFFVGLLLVLTVGPR